MTDVEPEEVRAIRTAVALELGLDPGRPGVAASGVSVAAPVGVQVLAGC